MLSPLSHFGLRWLHKKKIEFFVWFNFFFTHPLIWWRVMKTLNIWMLREFLQESPSNKRTGEEIIISISKLIVIEFEQFMFYMKFLNHLDNSDDIRWITSIESDGEPSYEKSTLEENFHRLRWALWTWLVFHCSRSDVISAISTRERH